MLPACGALAVSLALQAGVTRYTADIYTQIRHGTAVAPAEADEAAPAPGRATGLEVTPSIGLEHEERGLVLGIAYLPHWVVVIDYPPAQLFHRASLNLVLRPGPHLRLLGAASGGYGTTNLRLPSSTLAPSQGPGPIPVQPIPSLSTAKYLNASAELGFEARSSARLLVSGAASYLAQGGADAPARTALPLQRGPSLRAALAWAVAADDVLETTLAGSYYSFLGDRPAFGTITPGPKLWTAQAFETWQHAIGSRGSLRLGLGIGATGDAVELSRLSVRRTLPIGEATFRQGFGRLPARPLPGPLPGDRGEEEDSARSRPRPLPGDREEREDHVHSLPSSPIDLSAGLHVAPFVDFTSGSAYERGDASASLGWSPHRYWRLQLTSSVGVALEGPQKDQVTGAGQLAATWNATQWAELSAGLDGVWQQAGRESSARSLRQWSAFLGLRFRQRGEL
jgi:hypothetical protein